MLVKVNMLLTLINPVLTKLGLINMVGTNGVKLFNIFFNKSRINIAKKVLLNKGKNK